MRKSRKLKSRKELYAEVVRRYGKTMAIDFHFDILFRVHQRVGESMFSQQQMLALLEEVARNTKS